MNDTFAMAAFEGEIDSFKLIDRITLNEAPNEDEDGANPNYISLMTIHSSKGLEFPVVFLVGLEDGLIPHKNSIGSLSGICEERRLLYVAMTRAKEKLFMTYAHLRQSGYQKEARKASRFVSELPKEGIESPTYEEFHRTQQIKSQERKKSTVSRISSLRQSLKSGDL